MEIDGIYYAPELRSILDYLFSRIAMEKRFSKYFTAV